MSASIEELIERIASDPRCEVEWRDTSTPLPPPGLYVPHIPSGPLPPRLSVVLPEDMVYFRERVMKANIFAKTVPGGTIPEPNGWALWNVGFWGYDRLLDELFYYEDEEADSLWHQLDQCFIFATSAQDGAHMLAVDLRPQRYGQIIECLMTQITYGGDVPVVAHSFSEWLERTLDAGPSIKNGYWEGADFSDYGSALDGDPCYEPRPHDTM